MDKFTQKLKFGYYLLTSMPMKSQVDKAFLERHIKIEFQHSTKQLQQIGTFGSM